MDDLFKIECPKCGELKERTEFRALNRGQRSNFCEKCSTAVRENWFAQNSTAVADRLARWRETKRHK